MRGFSAALLLFVTLACSAHADTFLVLPFFNLSGSPSLSWIGESVAETVREAASSGAMVTLDREDREQAYHRLSVRPEARLTLATVVKIGQTLGADKILYGWFELTPEPAGAPKTRGTLRLSARFVDLKHMSEGRDFSETGALENLAQLQLHLAWQALQLLAPGRAPSQEEFGKQVRPVRVDALESYIRGLLASSTTEKRKLFAQAARLDAAFSQPSFELGRLSWQDRDFKQAAEWLAKVSPSDPHYHEATFLLGLSRYEMGDFAGAESTLQTVAAAVPLSEVFNDLGAAQLQRNKAEALASFQRALAGDAGDPVYLFNAGYALWKQGDFAGAEKNFRAVIERDPGDKDALKLLALCKQRSGPVAGDAGAGGLPRIKTNFEESAYRQLQDVFHSKQ